VHAGNVLVASQHLELVRAALVVALAADAKDEYAEIGFRMIWEMVTVAPKSRRPC
jgi:hypothetical protein